MRRSRAIVSGSISTSLSRALDEGVLIDSDTRTKDVFRKRRISFVPVMRPVQFWKVLRCMTQASGCASIPLGILKPKLLHESIVVKMLHPQIALRNVFHRLDEHVREDFESLFPSTCIDNDGHVQNTMSSKT
jgi:hypothetical protein